MSPRRAVVIGGGLAGMTVALQLARHGIPACIVEAGEHLGGKASARRWNGYWEDHGFHVFPAWYPNTRRLLGELGIAGNLIDFDRNHHLARGAFPRFITMYEWSSLGNILRNLRCGLLPLPDMLLSCFFLLDLASAVLSNDSYLDQISATGFLHSRFYATESVAVQQQEQVLQASAIPGYESSAKTIQNVVRAWLRSPTPYLSILNGSLQEKFIEPFAAALHKQMAPVTVLTGCKVVRLRVHPNGRISGIQLQAEQGADPEVYAALGNCSADDIYVLATPHEATLKLVDGAVFRAEQAHEPADSTDDRFGLADLVFLRSAPMAALHVHFTRRLPHIPKEHVMLTQSRFGIAFVDVSQHWEGLDHTTLNLIASNFEPLREVEPSSAIHFLLRELREFLPFTAEDLGVDINKPVLTDADRHALNQRCLLQTHVEQPLFLNTVGVWHFRPNSRTRIPNLFAAADYCRSDVDLTTMESAISAGLTAAGAIVSDAKIVGAGHAMVHIAPLPVLRHSHALLVLMKCGVLPIVAPVAAAVRLRDWWRRRVRARNAGSASPALIGSAIGVDAPRDDRDRQPVSLQ